MTEIPQKSSVLLTGASGRLGQLLRKSAHLQPVDGTRFLFQSRQPGLDVTWEPGQPADDVPPCDMIVALWGATAGDAQTLSVNSELVETGIALARSIGAKRIVHLSTAAVYGPGASLQEDAPLNTANAYGFSKLEMEQRVAERSDDPSLEHICLRLGNVVGADSLAPALRKDAPARLDQFADGHGPRRSYIGTGDFLKVLAALAQHPFGNWPAIMNVAAPDPIGMQDLLQAAGVSWAWHPAPPQAAQDASLDVSRMRTIFPTLYCANDAEALVNEWQKLERRP